MAATIFGSGLRGVRLLNDGGFKSETRDKYWDASEVQWWMAAVAVVTAKAIMSLE